MRLVTFQGPEGPRLGGMRDGAVVDLREADPGLPDSLKQLLCLGDAGLERAHTALRNGKPMAAQPQLLPPIVDPQKILCVGLNYADHAAETGAQVGEEPVIFNKLPTVLRGAGRPIELPPLAEKVDFEAELVVVMGREARGIERTAAWEHIAGYTCGNDVSARDWQTGKPGKQWLLGKSFDSFGPLGPALVTRDEVPNPGELPIRLRLNGQTMQDSSTRNLIFPIDYLVAYLSQVTTLLPGDLIFTGTPPGVGMARKPPVFLQAGDVVEVEIDGVGKLTNPVVGR